MVSFVVGFFQRLQLFFVAFSLAAGSMMFVGMASGKLERGETYVSLSEKFAEILMQVAPEFAARIGDGAASETVVARSNASAHPDIRSAGSASSSLEALRQRQFRLP